MGPKPLVILSGNTVTTWENWNASQDVATSPATPSQSKQSPFSFYPQGDLPLADVAWNHNGQVLATCSAVSTKDHIHNTVVLSAAQSGNVLDSLQHNQQWRNANGAGSTTSLAFGGKSRYLCIGDTSGAVCLWDLKKKLRVRQFFHYSDHGASLQVAVDQTDTYILSLTSTSLLSYKLREGIPAATWARQTQDRLFTKFNNSTLEPHLVFVGTDDGSLVFYDINNRPSPDPVLELSRRHQGSVTGVAFSYTNDKLVASSSTDGTLQFFDKASGSTIEQVAKLSSGISSLTLNVDGISCAVGTQSGKVLVYDLRKSSKPLASMIVEHAGPVRTVRFSPPPKKKNHLLSAAKPGAFTPASLSHQQQQTTPAAASAASTDRQSMVELRQDLDQYTISTDPSQPPIKHHQPPPQNHELQASLSPNISTGIVAAPQQESSQRYNLYPQPSELSETPPSSYMGPTRNATLDDEGPLTGQLATSSSPIKASSPSNIFYSIPPETASNDQEEQRVIAGASSLSFQDAAVPMATSPDAPTGGTGGSPGRVGWRAKRPKDYISPVSVAAGSPQRQSFFGSPGHLDRNRGIPPPLPESRAGPPFTTDSLPTKSAANPPLTLEEIRDVVRDEVENLQDDLEESIRNLHMDMIRQFHQQSQEWTSTLAHQLATLEELRIENQQLREENERLKKEHHQRPPDVHPLAASHSNGLPRRRKIQENTTIFGTL